MITKLKCLLLDDELLGLSYLKMLCEQIPELEVIRTYNNPQTLISDFEQLEFDLCILDIEMPNITGLEVAKKIKDKLIIFTTAYKEYAHDAFEIDAVDYLVKPIQKDRLQTAINKALNRFNNISQTPKYIKVNTDRGKTLLYIDQLQYIIASETDSRDKIAYTSNSKPITIKNISFKNLLELLPPRQFCRINKQEIIALSTIQSFSSDQIETNISLKTSGPLRLTLSEVYRENFIKTLKQ